MIALTSLHQKRGNHGHALVLPKQHVTSIYELPPACDASITSGLRLIAKSAKRAFAADGVSIRQNNEPAAGQDVFHLHFHVIPRFFGDEFDASPYEKPSLQIRQALAQKLRDAVQIDRPL